MLAYDYSGESRNPELIHTQDGGNAVRDWDRGDYVCERCGKRFSQEEAELALDTL